MYITHDKFNDFVNNKQRDSRLNELLFPYQSDDHAQELVQTYEANLLFAGRGINHIT